MAGVRHGMFKLMQHSMADEQHGKGRGAAWEQHGMCELALTLFRFNLNPYCLGRKAAFFSVGI
jgi:hypothetical protein